MEKHKKPAFVKKPNRFFKEKSNKKELSVEDLVKLVSEFNKKHHRE